MVESLKKKATSIAFIQFSVAIFFFFLTTSSFTNDNTSTVYLLHLFIGYLFLKVTWHAQKFS